MSAGFPVLDGQCFPVVFLDECSQMIEVSGRRVCSIVRLPCLIVSRPSLFAALFHVGRWSLPLRAAARGWRSQAIAAAIVHLRQCCSRTCGATGHRCRRPRCVGECQWQWWQWHCTECGSVCGDRPHARQNPVHASVRVWAGADATAYAVQVSPEHFTRRQSTVLRGLVLRARLFVCRWRVF